jgi:hypothetical protein
MSSKIQMVIKVVAVEVRVRMKLLPRMVEEVQRQVCPRSLACSRVGIRPVAELQVAY